MVLEWLDTVLIGLGFLVIAAISSIIYARWNYGTLEKMGIPVVKPHFFLGSAQDTFSRCIAHIDLENFKRLGPIFGVYEGRTPQLYVCDANLLRLIMAKDAEYFNSKRAIDFRNPLLNEMLDFQPYGKWKVIRSEMATALTLAKVKKMSAVMTFVCDRYVKHLKDTISSSPNKCLEQCDIRDGVFVMLTEMISSCCFNIKIDNPTNRDNYFVKIVREFMQPDVLVSYPKLENLAFSFPILTKMIPATFTSKSSDEFTKVFKELIAARRQSGQKLNDVVDLCIEWIDKLDTPEYKANNVTEETVICHAFLFFFAGQDQLSTTISVMMYHILKNKDTLARLQAEVDSFFSRHKGEVKHENLSELTYLTACINEGLRFAPFFARTERVCTKDWKNEEFNLDIKKGTVIMLPLWPIMRNPKYYEDPEEFHPERFLPENKDKLNPYAFAAFGFGPRQCIGVKFSYETMILISLFLLKNFEFHLRKDSEPVYIPAGNFISVHLPFYFDVTLRK